KPPPKSRSAAFSTDADGVLHTAPDPHRHNGCRRVLRRNGSRPRPRCRCERVARGDPATGPARSASTVWARLKSGPTAGPYCQSRTRLVEILDEQHLVALLVIQELVGDGSDQRQPES